MINLLKQVNEKLSPVENMYDFIRIVDPKTKTTLIIKDNKIENHEGTCFDHWKRGKPCSNCISAKTYNKNDSFVKIDHVDKKIFIVSTLPLSFNGGTAVIEMLKCLSQKEIENNQEIYISDSLMNIINEMNKRVIINDDQDEESKETQEEKSYIEMLNIRIQEVRDVLNEMCITSDDIIEYKQKLELSQYLDELIVEYMKNISKNK